MTRHNRLIMLSKRYLLLTLFTLSLPSYAETSQSTSDSAMRNSVALGALVFADNCRHCHQIDGYGEEALYPSLRNETLLANKSLLIETVLNGRLAHTEAQQEAVRVMPSMEFLTNREIAAIIAFISNSWGNEVLMVTDEQIEAARK